MAEFFVQHIEVQTGIATGLYVPERLTWSMRRSQPGEITYEIPLSEPALSYQAPGGDPDFGPYRTDWYLYRNGKLLNAGMITSVNLNADRDSILVAGKDWLHYLQRRKFPFDPNNYRDGDWVNWPKGWPNEGVTLKEVQNNPVDVVEIVEGIINAMMESTLPDIPFVTGDTTPRGRLPIKLNNPSSGLTTKYNILPADSRSIFDHITTLSEQVNGFDFEITPLDREFRMYFPNRDKGWPVYEFSVSPYPEQTGEMFGAILSADWTNDGPEGTFLWGKGTTEKSVGAVWYYKPSVDKYRWLDADFDYGEVMNGDLIFDKLKDENALYIQEKLALSILNPEFMNLNFYGGDRPRSLLGNRVRFTHSWSPYRQLDNYYLVNAINCQVDQSTNETVELELEVINE